MILLQTRRDRDAFGHFPLGGRGTPCMHRCAFSSRVDDTTSPIRLGLCYPPRIRVKDHRPIWAVVVQVEQ
ncbi:unnamed protein product [Haemonchus placei]|uniref:Uncharacterized protein n=1 Tax=Haemonchus placei TaxID=6290 RepID=A0A0N4WL56_HAEPC|nr:unnamed protein product [Haemonchus placei]